MDFSFFIGLGLGGLGSFAALKMLHKKELFRLKKRFSSQQETYEEDFQIQLKDYADKLHIYETEQQQQQQQHNCEAELQTLQQQLKLQTAETQKLTQLLKAEQALTQSHRKQLQEHRQGIDEVLESLEQSQQEVVLLKEEEIKILKAQLNEYAIDLEQKKSELFTLSQQSQNGYHLNATEGGDRLTDENIKELIAVLFPDMSFMRDSIDILVADPGNLVQLTKALKDVTEGQAYSAKKVRATDNKWTECRVPHINMMRIYYQKCKKKSGYQVLISPKKNQKSQDQDYEWLKSHSNC